VAHPGRAPVITSTKVNANSDWSLFISISFVVAWRLATRNVPCAVDGKCGEERLPFHFAAFAAYFRCNALDNQTTVQHDLCDQATANLVQLVGCVDGLGDVNADTNADCIRNGATGNSPVIEMVHAVTPVK
jgi:hypothetical protein